MLQGVSSQLSSYGGKVNRKALDQYMSFTEQREELGRRKGTLSSDTGPPSREASVSHPASFPPNPRPTPSRPPTKKNPRRKPPMTEKGLIHNRMRERYPRSTPRKEREPQDSPPPKRKRPGHPTTEGRERHGPEKPTGGEKNEPGQRCTPKIPPTPGKQKETRRVEGPKSPLQK
eukprot:gene31776-6972_t